MEFSISDSAPIESSVKNPASAPFGINSASSALSRILRYMTLAMAALTILVTYLFEQIWQWGEPCDQLETYVTSYYQLLQSSNVQNENMLTATSLPKKNTKKKTQCSQSLVKRNRRKRAVTMADDDLYAMNEHGNMLCSILPTCIQKTTCFCFAHSSILSFVSIRHRLYVGWQERTESSNEDETRKISSSERLSPLRRTPKLPGCDKDEVKERKKQSKYYVLKERRSSVPTTRNQGNSQFCSLMRCLEQIM